MLDAATKDLIMQRKQHAARSEVLLMGRTNGSYFWSPKANYNVAAATLSDTVGVCGR